MGWTGQQGEWLEISEVGGFFNFLTDTVYGGVDCFNQVICVIQWVLSSQRTSHGRPEGEQYYNFCVTILTFGQNTNICSLFEKFAPPTKTPVDAHGTISTF